MIQVTRHQGGETVPALNNSGHPTLVSSDQVFVYQYDSRAPNQDTPIWYNQTRVHLDGNRDPFLIWYPHYDVTVVYT